MKTKIIHLPIWKLGHFNIFALNQKGKAKCLFEEFIFNDEAKYFIGNDQGDWNKLIGLGELLLDHQKSSVMIGWRFYEEHFQFIPYLHDKNGTVSKFYEPVQFKKGKASIYLDRETLQISLYDEKNNLVDSKIWKFLGKNILKEGFLHKITSWFGGNRVPDKKVTIYG